VSRIANTHFPLQIPLQKSALLKDFSSVLLLLIVPILLFLLVKFDLFNRAYADGISLGLFCLCCLRRLRFILFFCAVASITSLHVLMYGSYLHAVNFTILPLAALTFVVPLISKSALNKVLPPLVLYTCAMTLFDFVTGAFVEAGDRISGPFTSSLHLAYFLVILSVVVLRSNLRIKIPLIVMLVIAAAISGSRVGLIGCLVSFLAAFGNVSFKVKATIIFALIVVSFTSIIELLPSRGISYHPEAEAVRLYGWVRFYEYLATMELLQALLGNGRLSYGAVGFRFIGELAFITESSFIMLLYSYGLLLGLLMAGFIVYRFLNLSEISLIIRFMLVGFFIASPFIDSPIIFIINIVLLSSSFPFLRPTLRGIR
jgi:hypothetical protein